MPIDLKSGVGTADANSYVSLDEANAYFEARLHTEPWDDVGDDEKRKAALIMGTLFTDQEDWDPDRVGAKVDSDQALRFPAEDVKRRDDPDGEEEYPTDEIPDFVVHAALETALAMLATDRLSETSVTQSGGIKLEKVGPLTREYFQDRTVGHTNREALPAAARKFLEWWTRDDPVESGISFAETVRVN